MRSRANQAFIGDFTRGIGFVLEPDEAAALIARDSRNAECLKPYLGGEDLNTDPEQRPSRFVICFEDWPLERAAAFPDLLRILEERVKPERQNAKDSLGRDKWWLFYRWRRDLRRAIAAHELMLARSRVSEHHMLALVRTRLVASEEVIAFPFDDFFHFALLQSNAHEAWVLRNASSLESRNRYTPSDCFETFPFPDEPPPQARAEAERLSEQYQDHRRQMMLTRRLGLTKTYNLFHTQNCTDADVVHLRELHAAMDRAILACYGWTDLDPVHGFHQNERGQTRFTISPAARRELLRRLLALNLELAAREAAGGNNPGR